MRYSLKILVTYLLFVFGVVTPAFADDFSEILNRAREIETVQITVTGQRFEPQQTISPGAPSRHASNYSLVTHWSPSQEKAKEAWQLNTVYPFPNAFTFEAEYNSTGGTRTGRDGFRPNTDGPVSPARLGAVLKDLWLTNPILLIAHKKDYASNFPRKGGTAGAFTFDAHGTQWTIYVDPVTQLPTWLETIEKDHLEGSLINRVAFSDWRMVEGVPFPFRLEQTINGQLIRREVREAITLNGALATTTETTNQLDEVELEQKALGWSMSHFFLRRALLGAPSDGDEAAKVQINDLGGGIYQVVGSSHHTVIIEGRKGLAIVDAVWYPSRSEAILDAIKAKWRKKPIKYVILTHHHIDHVGGLGPFAALGATIVTGAENFDYFHDILVKTQQTPPSMQVVPGRISLSGLGRSIEMFDIPNSHANDMIGIYVPDVKTAINTDLYSPGRPGQQPVWAREFADAIKFHGLDVEQHVGGHGSGTEPHENLVKLVSGK